MTKLFNLKNNFQSYFIWVLASLFVVYSFCLNTAAAVFTDAIKTTLNASPLDISLATGSFIFGFAALQIPIGFLLDRFNARYIVNAGILLLVLGNIALSFSDNLILFTISNFLQGIGASGAFVSAAVLISQWFPQRMFPILFGLTQSAACIAAGALHYLFALMLDAYSWNQIYLLLSGFGSLLFLLSCVFVRSPKGAIINPPSIKDQPIKVPEKTFLTSIEVKRKDQNLLFVMSLKQSLIKTFKNHQIILCGLAAATSFGVLLSFASFWYLDIHKFYLINKLDSVLISGVIFLGIGIGTPLLSWLSNKIQSRTAVLHFSLILGVMALILGVYLPHFNFETLIIIKLVSFFIGFFLSGSMLFYTMVAELSTADYRGVALSVLNTMVFLFNTLMLFIPLIFVTHNSKEFFTYLWTLPFFILISVLLLYYIKDTYDIERVSQKGKS